MIFTIFLNKAVVGTQYKKNDSKEAEKVEIAIVKLNDSVKSTHNALRNLIEKKLFVKEDAFDLKREILTSLVYENLKFGDKKIRVNAGYLVQLLHTIRNLKSNNFIDVNHLKVFDLFDSKTKELKGNIKIDNKKDINLIINFKFLMNYSKFSEIFSQEIKVNNNTLKNMELGFCKNCGLIVPMSFILVKDRREQKLLSSFYNKLRYDFLNGIDKIFMHPNFARNEIENSDKMVTALKDLLNYCKDHSLDSKLKSLIQTFEEEFCRLKYLSSEAQLAVFIDFISNVKYLY